MQQPVSSPPQRETASASASASPSGSTDPGYLRNIERCSEASCSKRSEDALKLRRFVGAAEAEPPDRMELGQSAWAVLHATAAKFPMEPTIENKEKTQRWLNAFFSLYPCTHCRGHIAPFVKSNPVDMADSERLSVWVCQAHNFVNNDLGKDLETCDGIKLRQMFANSQMVRRPDL